jgi:hypothetical protein
MSAFNWFTTEAKALDLRTKQLTTAAGEITYTARTGYQSNYYCYL